MLSRHKQQKKKDREKRVQEKLLKARQYKLEIKRLQKEAVKANKFEVESVDKTEAMKRIQKNIEILKGMEDEQKKQEEARKNLNEKLEGEGHFTLQDKVKAIAEKTKEGHDDN